MSIAENLQSKVRSALRMKWKIYFVNFKCSGIWTENVVVEPETCNLPSFFLYQPLLQFVERAIENSSEQTLDTNFISF